MDEVVRRIAGDGLPVYVYESKSTFVDVADQESYEKANEEFGKVLGNV